MLPLTSWSTSTYGSLLSSARIKPKEHAHTYIKGLMVCPERKSIEPIALLVGNGQVSAMQKSTTLCRGTMRTCRPRFKASSSMNWCQL